MGPPSSSPPLLSRIEGVKRRSKSERAGSRSERAAAEDKENSTRVARSNADKGNERTALEELNINETPFGFADPFIQQPDMESLVEEITPQMMASALESAFKSAAQPDCAGSGGGSRGLSDLWQMFRRPQQQRCQAFPLEVFPLIIEYRSLRHAGQGMELLLLVSCSSMRTAIVERFGIIAEMPPWLPHENLPPAHCVSGTKDAERAVEQLLHQLTCSRPCEGVSDSGLVDALEDMEERLLLPLGAQRLQGHGVHAWRAEGCARLLAGATSSSIQCCPCSGLEQAAVCHLHWLSTRTQVTADDQQLGLLSRAELLVVTQVGTLTIDACVHS